MLDVVMLNVIIMIVVAYFVNWLFRCIMTFSIATASLMKPSKRNLIVTGRQNDVASLILPHGKIFQHVSLNQSNLHMF
jgi:hypothetical protein